MGVKFKDIIEPEIINLKDLNGRIIANMMQLILYINFYQVFVKLMEHH